MYTKEPLPGISDNFASTAVPHKWSSFTSLLNQTEKCSGGYYSGGLAPVTIRIKGIKTTKEML